MIFLPLLIGQALALDVHGQLGLTFFLYTLLFGVLYQVYLLYLNDYADEAVDRANDHYFLSGGSRVLPEGKLQPDDLLVGARAVFVVLVALAVWLGVFLDRPWMLVGTGLAFALCWAYNSKPLQMSYRGHGEILQGLGCGVLLPLIGFYLQHGSLQVFPWIVLGPLYLIFHAGNIITALPDYPSDRAGGKQTFPVRRGETRARKTALGLLALACVLVVVASVQRSMVVVAIMVGPAVLILAGVVLTGLLKRANASEFPRCRRFVVWSSASQAWLLCAWIGVLLMGGSD